MDVRAILLTGIPAESTTASTLLTGSSPETFSGVPLVFLPLLGSPLLHRFADRLKQARVDSISILNASDPSFALAEDARRADLYWKDITAEQVWRAAEDQFDELVHDGAEIVLVIRLGAYAHHAGRGWRWSARLLHSLRIAAQ